jgi:hypothetical protein
MAAGGEGGHRVERAPDGPGGRPAGSSQHTAHTRHDTRALNVTVHTCVHSTLGRADPGKRPGPAHARQAGSWLLHSYSGIPSSYHRHFVSCLLCPR